MNRELFQTVLADKRDDRPRCLKDTVRRPNSFLYYKLFVRLAKAMNPELIVELGTSQGVGALHFRHGSKTAKIITVDIIRSKLTKDRLFAHDIKGILCDAVTYADYVDDNSVDILFIDTNQNKANELGAYKLLTRELAAWLPKMKTGGIVLFDDIRNGNMSKAWEELKGDKQEIRGLHATFSFGVLFI